MTILEKMKTWLDEHLTKNEESELYEIIKNLVGNIANEELTNNAKKRTVFAQVNQYLIDYKLEISNQEIDDFIEQAVKEVVK